jgi:hypothetical protein
MRRQILSLTLICCMAYFGYGFACSKASTLSWSKEGVSALQEAQPLLVAAGLPADKITTAIEWGNKLVAKLEDPSSTPADPASLARGVITAFQDVVAQTNLIKDQQKKVVVLAILGIANIALHHIADAVLTPTSGVALDPVVGKFKAAKPWRCRSSQTGKFEKMSFCKNNPAVSVVEAY